MTQNFVNIFKESCVRLAETVVINHPYTGMVINQRLKTEGYGAYTQDHDRNTWKYYLNMAGQYHAYDEVMIHRINRERGLGLSDNIDQTKMIITIAGDAGPVEKEFSIENISGPLADENISAEYQQGSTSYNALVDIYPEFEELIKGILHPIPLEVSINAEDFAVLYCGGYYRTRLNTLNSEYAFIKGESLIYNYINLIEDWELSLIDNIQEYTKTYFRQHDNRAYGAFNDLYFAASIGIYYLNLPAYIFNLRLEKFKTSEAHSTHVLLYLDSYIELGQYMSYLSRKQHMYLYRNVEWLSCNAGKEKVFEELIENILKPSGISVFYYEGLQDTENHSRDLEPESAYIRVSGDITKMIDTKTRYTVKDVVNLLVKSARDNPLYLEDQIEDVTEAGLASKSSLYKTKIVETHLNRQTLVTTIPKEEFLLNNWIYSSQNGEYTGILSVINPDNGARIQLTVKNACILFLFIHMRVNLKLDIKTLDSLYISHIPKTFSELPALEDIQKIPSDVRVSDETIKKIYSLSPSNRRYTSTGQFGRDMDINWDRFNTRNYMGYSEQGIRSSAQIKHITNVHYFNDVVSIDVGGDFDRWLIGLGVDLATFSESALKTIANSILKTALDLTDEDEETLKRIHNAMVNIVKTFASYNIQFVTKTASGELSNVGVNYIRMETVKSSEGGYNDYHIYNYAGYDTITKPVRDVDTYYRNMSWRADTHEANKYYLSKEQYDVLILSETVHGRFPIEDPNLSVD